jgi:ABC-type Fe3+-hydroxamate transport system substrate-binding protein
MPYVSSIQNIAVKKIVSLVPSLTELLADIGLDKEVVGITKFCVHPDDWIRRKTIIGGTKQLHLNKIVALNPDLIIANKEENVHDEIGFLAEHFNVLLTDINTYAEALETIENIGILCNRKEKAEKWIQAIADAFQNYQSHKENLTCIYLIWHEPHMAVGPNTYIHSMLQKLGFQNLIHTPRYPALTLEDIKKMEPKLILLSSEPYPFKDKHMQYFQNELKSSQVLLVDGEMFSWYGSRMAKLPDYVNQLNAMII